MMLLLDAVDVFMVAHLPQLVPRRLTYLLTDRHRGSHIFRTNSYLRGHHTPVFNIMEMTD